VLSTIHRPTPESAQLLSVTTVPGSHPGRVVVEVVGEVDAYTAPVLDACLTSQSRRADVHELTVQLGRVTFLDAAGIKALARADRRCRRRGARLIIRTGGRRAVLRPLQLTGLADLVADDPAGTEPKPSRSPRTGARPRTHRQRSPLRRPRRAFR
jgi:anti-anti-sigma factor